MNARRIVVVLLSGGIDSTVAAAMKLRDPKNLVYFLSIYYGQGGEDAEKVTSQGVADWFLDRHDNAIEHFTITIDGGSRRCKTELMIDGVQLLPRVSTGGFAGWRKPGGGWPQAGYPSTRDEAFSLIAAAGVEARLRDVPFATEGEAVIATNKDDIDNFSDILLSNYSEHLNGILARKLMPQLGKPLKIDLPLIGHTKIQVLELGFEIGAPLDLTWSCYFGSPGAPCGKCDQCKWRAEAFRSIGRPDPAPGHKPAKGGKAKR